MSFDPTETPALGRRQEEGLPRPLQAPRRGGGLALPDRRRGVDRRGSPARSASATSGRADASSSPTPRASWCSRPTGAISRYFFGVEYAPKDLRLALVEAADGRIGTPVDQLLLYCYHYDPQTGRYSAVDPRTWSASLGRADRARPRRLHPDRDACARERRSASRGADRRSTMSHRLPAVFPSRPRPSPARSTRSSCSSSCVTAFFALADLRRAARLLRGPVPPPLRRRAAAARSTARCCSSSPGPSSRSCIVLRDVRAGARSSSST